MRQIIQSVDSITSGEGWVFTDNGAPVLCFALVSVVTHEHVAHGVERIIIAVAPDDMTMLQGSDVTDRMTDVDRVLEDGS